MNSTKPPSLESKLVDISTVIDGELEHCDLLDTIDNIARSEDCRRFYLTSRDADASLASGPIQPSDAPDLWPAIAQQAGHGAASRKGQRGWLIAAALFGATVLSMLLIRNLPRNSTAGGGATAEVTEVTLGSQTMTENRFFEIATEVLQADRHTRRELVRLIDSVEREASRNEAREARAEAPRDSIPAAFEGLPDVGEGGSRDRLNIQVW